MFKIKQKSFSRSWEDRLKILRGVYIFFFFLLLLKLFYIQVIRHKHYLKRLKRMAVVRYVLLAPRGQIITSDGVIIATNRASFQLYIDRSLPRKKIEILLERLARLLNRDLGDLKERYVLGCKKFTKRVLLLKDLSWDEISRILSSLYFLPGVNIEVQSERYYPYGKMYFHLVGYVDSISREEYLRLKNKGYSIEDYIGKRGIERVFEKYLKGKNGYVEVQRDVYGRLGKVLKRVEPVPGKDLILTVNHRLQSIIYKVMKDKVGAVVAISAKDGRLLAMVSSPTVDPQKYVSGFKPGEWKKINKDPRRPLTNRALSSYPPGSTFKPITAMAGLSAGVIKSVYQKIECPGYLKYKRRIFRCWKAHGEVDFFKAIYESCDTYFYWVATQLDVDYLAKVARSFGFGESTGIGFPEESIGLVPDRNWKRKVFHTIWYPGETLYFAIGQGFLKVTPLQLARAYMALINYGKLYKVYVVKEIVDSFHKRVIKFEPVLERELSYKKIYYDWIKQALIEVVEKGTGQRAKVEGLVIGGKTGTAQVVSSRLLEKGIKKKRWEHHAWFVSFVLNRSPQIVMTVFVEHGGHGGSAAAPLAGKIYREFYLGFQNDTNKKIPQL